jgi:hypothetical protein
MKFLGDRAAANDFTALQNERLEATFRQVKPGDECVVTAANDDYALSDRHGQFFSLSGTTTEGLASGGADDVWEAEAVSDSLEAGGCGGSAGASTVATCERVAGFVLSDRDAATDFFHSFNMT